jgi:hypothetical protein
MRAFGMLILAVGLIFISSEPLTAQPPANPATAQIVGLRKELQRQRKVQDSLRADLESARTQLDTLNRRLGEQEADLASVRRDLAQTWGGGAVGLAMLLVVLLLIAMRRPPRVGNPDELHQRLAALDQKLRDLARS